MSAHQPIDLDHGRRVIAAAYGLFLRMQGAPVAPVAPPPPPPPPAVPRKPLPLDLGSDGGFEPHDFSDHRQED